VWNTVDQNHAFSEIYTETQTWLSNTYIYSGVQFHLKKKCVLSQYELKMKFQNVLVLDRTTGDDMIM